MCRKGCWRASRRPDVCFRSWLSAGDCVQGSLAAGGGDQTVGGVGCGIVRAGTIAATIGTSGVVFGAATSLCGPKARAMYSLCHSVPENTAS
ncbi:MAG: hypothetical protein ACLR30_11345 [[Clostridium] leptum]